MKCIAWEKFCEVRGIEPEEEPPREVSLDFCHWFTDRLNEHPREKPFDEWLSNWKDRSKEAMK